MGIKQRVALTDEEQSDLIRMIYPELYWKVFNELTLAFEDQHAIRLYCLLRRDASEITWYLIINKFVEVNLRNTKGGKWVWVEDWHIRFLANHFASYNLALNGHTPAVEFLPFLERHLCKGWLS